MRPLKDWMELKRYDKPSSLLVPDSAEGKVSDSDVFEILAKGPDVPETLNVGDMVQPCGMGSVIQLPKPNGEMTYVGRADDVAFIIEKGDL